MAKQIAEDTEHKHMFKRGKVWWVSTMRNGERTITSTKQTDLKKARLIRDDLLNPYNLRDEKKRVEAMLARVQTVEQNLAVIEDAKPATTIAHGWQAYLDRHNRPDTGPSTLEVYEGQYEAFAKWFAGNYPQKDKDGNPIRWELRQVTQEHADRYAGHLLKIVSASTFNRHLNLLSLVWRILEGPARIGANPWKQIGRKRFAVHSRRELTVEELGRVIAAAQGEMRVLLALGTFCGLRLGDAACLDWGSVDLVKGIISLIPSKTARRKQKRVTLPIHPALLAMLEGIPADNRRGYVLPAMAERYAAYDGALAKDVARLFLSVNIKTGANSLTKAERDELDKAISEAKAEGREPPKVKRTVRRASADCGYHSLRHTFVSLCAAGGVSQSVVQSLVGHGSPAMTAHYTHIGIEAAQRAVAMLPDVTHTDTEEDAANAARAKLDAVLTSLEGLTPEQIQEVAKRVREMIGGAA